MRFGVEVREPFAPRGPRRCLAVRRRGRSRRAHPRSSASPRRTSASSGAHRTTAAPCAVTAGRSTATTARSRLRRTPRSTGRRA